MTRSGVICTEAGATCKTKKTEEMHATWTGPFACDSTHCGSNTGFYELDTIRLEKGVKRTKGYAYEQDIHICLVASPTKCADYYVGLQVGP